MAINLKAPELTELRPRITVLGVGGAGGNAVNNMIVSGLSGVDRDMLEAGRGQGMAETQILRKVELPLSVAVITVGIRSASIQVIATATLGAVFGFGGLGRYLVNGVSHGDQGQIFGGVVLVAGLVLVTELGFAITQRLLTPRGLRIAPRPTA